MWYQKNKNLYVPKNLDIGRLQNRLIVKLMMHNSFRLYITIYRSGRDGAHRAFPSHFSVPCFPSNRQSANLFFNNIRTINNIFENISIFSYDKRLPRKGIISTFSLNNLEGKNEMHTSQWDIIDMLQFQNEYRHWVTGEFWSKCT